MQFGIIGSGSWGTALAKMLTDNGLHINWCVRNEEMIKHIQKRKHNPNYLTSVSFDIESLSLYTDPEKVLAGSDCIVVVTPLPMCINSLPEYLLNYLPKKKSYRL